MTGLAGSDPEYDTQRVTTSRYDPAELEAHSLTEEEAEEIREAMEEVDRGESRPLEDVRTELLAEIEAVARVRRAG